MISRELADFCESPVSILIGSVDSGLVPDGMRAFAARVEEEGRVVSVCQPHATGTRMLANLRDNGRVAVCFVEIKTHRSIQVEGRVIELRAGDEEDAERLERYLVGLAEELAFIGLPRRITLRLSRRPFTVVRFAVESLFVQTPGPGAGAPLAPAGGSWR